MNIRNLEKAARAALKGGKIETNALTPVEHRSLKSLSWQIASNVRADKAEGTLALIMPKRFWA